MGHSEDKESEAEVVIFEKSFWGRAEGFSGLTASGPIWFGAMWILQGANLNQELASSFLLGFGFMAVVAGIILFLKGLLSKGFVDTGDIDKAAKVKKARLILAVAAVVIGGAEFMWGLTMT